MWHLCGECSVVYRKDASFNWAPPYSGSMLLWLNRSFFFFYFHTHVFLGPACWPTLWYSMSILYSVLVLHVKERIYWMDCNSTEQLRHYFTEPSLFLLYCLYDWYANIVRPESPLANALTPGSSACVCVRACVCVCVRPHASAHRKLNIRTRLDAKKSLHPDASFVQGLSGCTIPPSALSCCIAAGHGTRI